MSSATLRADASDDDDDDDDHPAPGFQPPIMAQLLHQAGGCGSSDDDADEEEDKAAVAAPVAAPAAAVGDAAEAQEPAAAAVGDEDGSELPSALDALDDDGGQDFLVEKYTPEFDASKRFKPPPVTAADLGPAYGTERMQMGNPNVPPPRGWQGEHNFRRADEDQRYDANYNFGRQPGSNRLRGSVCHETDDERGRRVRYGAHAALAADPWSACNPNYSMNDNRVTRGMDRRPITGAKRPAKERPRM